MSELKHKAKGGEKKVNKPQREEDQERGIKASPQFTRPAIQLLQLQQLAGNKTVTNMGQRHPEWMMNRFNWKVQDLDQDVSESWFHTRPLGGQEGKSE
jgi:hypothetical protein